MSAHESFEAIGYRSPDDGAAGFTRWPGLLSLTLGLLLGPIAALLNQELMYSVNMWACGHQMPVLVHLVPALCLIVAVGAGLMARRDWRAVGAGVEDEEAAVEARTRFVALMGMAISAFSSLVIVAMWAAAFVFGPCMRA
jgi:hypothetical protein